jgi:hypothetical protein
MNTLLRLNRNQWLINKGYEDLTGRGRTSQIIRTHLPIFPWPQIREILGYVTQSQCPGT